MNSGAVQVVSSIIGILGAIGSIVLGNNDGDFNIVILISGFVSTALLVFLLMIFARIMEQNEEILERLGSQEKIASGSLAEAGRLPIKSNSPPPPNYQAQSSEKKSPYESEEYRSSPHPQTFQALSYSKRAAESDGSWKCRKCGDKNANSARSCKGCGTDK